MENLQLPFSKVSLTINVDFNVNGKTSVLCYHALGDGSVRGLVSWEGSVQTKKYAGQNCNLRMPSILGSYRLSDIKNLLKGKARQTFTNENYQIKVNGIVA